MLPIGHSISGCSPGSVGADGVDSFGRADSGTVVAILSCEEAAIQPGQTAITGTVGDWALILADKADFVSMEQLEILIGNAGDFVSSIAGPVYVSASARYVAPHDVRRVEIHHRFRGGRVREAEVLHSERYRHFVCRYSVLENRYLASISSGGKMFRHIDIGPDTLVLRLCNRESWHQFKG